VQQILKEYCEIGGAPSPDENPDLPAKLYDEREALIVKVKEAHERYRFWARMMEPAIRKCFSGENCHMKPILPSVTGCLECDHHTNSFKLLEFAKGAK